ncbi:MAG: S-adenosylmethionine:tRNA ribosyltransferase-isomerase [Phycisphaerae bacterium]
MERNAQRCVGLIGESLSLICPAKETSAAGITLIAKERGERGMWQLQLATAKPKSAAQILERAGPHAPSAVHQTNKGADDHDVEDSNRYQTIYADKPGAVAAPTAGLHFTEPLLEKIKNANVATHYVTLHVGYGTFAPVEVSNLADHKYAPRVFRDQLRFCKRHRPVAASKGDASLRWGRPRRGCSNRHGWPTV